MMCAGVVEQVENSLVPRGYKVTTCMSGPEALELIDSRGFLPDLILLDCMMPTMSGCEMCERLRLNYPCNTLPVIMVSAKDQEDDIVKGLKSGWYRLPCARCCLDVRF